MIEKRVSHEFLFWLDSFEIHFSFSLSLSPNEIMAQSRLPSFGTIFTRVQGLLRAGGMKESEKPIWYEVYEAFPPRFSVHDIKPEVLSSPVKPIFYQEDKIRA